MFVMPAGYFQLILILLTVQATVALRARQPSRGAPAGSRELYSPAFTYEEYREFEAKRRGLHLGAQGGREGSDEAMQAYVHEVLPVWGRLRARVLEGTTPISHNDSGKLVVGATFPNSGTTITRYMSQGIAGWNNGATVYDYELGGHGHLVPGTGDVYIQDARPIGGGSAMGRALVKSHCKGYGPFADPDRPYMMSLADCVDLRDGRLHAGTLHVHRNPLDSLVARFHLEQRVNRTRATDADFRRLFGSFKPDLRVHMRWLCAAKGFLADGKVEVLWYEDLLADPNKYAQNLARIIGVTESRRSDKAINWEDKVFHREELRYVGNELLPVYLHMYTPEMVRDVGQILREEFTLWKGC